MKQSKRIALGGLLVALSVTVMVLGGYLYIGTFAAPVLAMIVLLPLQEEYGLRTAGAAYAAAAILALLLVPDRELPFVYLFFGWYPLLRSRWRNLPALPQLLWKLAIYTVSVLTLYGLLLRLMGLTSDLLESARWMNALLFLMGALLFLLLDRVLDRMTLLWRNRLRKRLLH